MILWGITEEIRTLLLIRNGLDQGRPLDPLLKDAKVWGARQLLVKKAVQRLSARKLQSALQHAARIDRLIKGIGQGSLREEFLQLGLSLRPHQA